MSGFVLAKFLLQYAVIAPGFELHRDEFLHLDQAHHLAWGYLSVPPVTSWISRLIFLLGGGEFWVKFFPALFGALTMVVVWKTAERLHGGYFARVMGGAALLFSVLLRTNTLYQPNSLDILCWTLIFYLVIRYIQSGNHSLLYLCGGVFAVGFLNKYSICILIVALLIGMVLTPQRTIYKRKELYVAGLLALLLILPNLWWQWQQGWPVVTHMSQLISLHLVHVSRGSFLLEQLLFFLPSLFLIMGGLFGLIFYKPFAPYRIIGYTYLLTIGIFLYMQGKPYYVIGVYPVLIAFGTVWFEKLSLRSGWYCLRYLAMSVVIGTGTLFLAATCPVFPPETMVENTQLRHIYDRSGQNTWEDGKNYDLPQDYADMVGWKELAKITGQALQRLSEAEREKVFILCNDYGQAGAINYYLRPDRPAGSFGADYRNWFPTPPYKIGAVILVEGWNENYEKDLLSDSSHPFTRVDYIGSIQNPYSRERGTSVYLLRSPQRSLTTDDLQEIK